MSESTNRFVVVQFCDDVRQELGNKFSLMGCYAGELLVDEMPALLPKLCAQIKVLTPKGRPFEKLKLRALLNDDLLGELELPVQNFSATLSNAEPASARLVYHAVMNFTPFPIEKEGILAIEAETESGVLVGPKLRLLLSKSFREATESSPRHVE